MANRLVAQLADRVRAPRWTGQLKAYFARSRSSSGREQASSAQAIETKLRPTSPPPPPAGWELLGEGGLEAALSIRIAAGETSRQRPERWLPEIASVAGGSDRVGGLPWRSVQRAPEPVPEPWKPGEPWLPSMRPRGSTKDWRVGYPHVWKLEDYTARTRRPYLLRMDLARIPPKDEPRPVADMFTPVEIPLVSKRLPEKVPIEWSTAEPLLDPGALVPRMAPMGRPGWRSIMDDDGDGWGDRSPDRAEAVAERGSAGSSGSTEADGTAGGDDG